MRTATRATLLLVALWLAVTLGTGCTSSKVIKPNQQANYRPEINRKAQGSTARVTLRNGRKLKLKQLHLGPDSSSGIDKKGSVVSIASSRIDQVKLKDRIEGAIRGAIYLGVPALLTSFIVDKIEPDLRPVISRRTLQREEIITGVPTMVGATVGAISGHEEIYHFEGGASQQPPIPAKDEEKPIAQKQPTEVATPENQTEDESTREGKKTIEKDTTLESVDTQIPKTSLKRPDDIAVVLGVKEYENSDVPNVDYAVRDAQTMKKYLTRTLGFREENIIYVENASGADFTRIFGTDDSPQGQLYDWVKPGKSSVFVYYSGHGAPNPESGNAYFIPSDTNPNYLSQNGYPVNQLYENLAQLPAESVTVVLEACFSGVSEGGAVVSDVSPAVLSVENPVMSLENGLAFTAGAADQVSTWYNEKKHGLFTYYFLNGLRGKADANDDQAVTAKEMESYLTENVPYRAQRMHSRKQTPQVVGQNLERVLVRYDGATSAQPEARLPVTTTDVQQRVKEALSLPNGALKVTDASGAETLRRGDVILEVANTDLNDESTLHEIIGRHNPGNELTLRVFRNGNVETVSVTLTAAR